MFELSWFFYNSDACQQTFKEFLKPKTFLFNKNCKKLEQKLSKRNLKFCLSWDGSSIIQTPAPRLPLFYQSIIHSASKGKIRKRKTKKFVSLFLTANLKTLNTRMFHRNALKGSFSQNGVLIHQNPVDQNHCNYSLDPT